MVMMNHIRKKQEILYKRYKNKSLKPFIKVKTIYQGLDKTTFEILISTETSKEI